MPSDDLSNTWHVNNEAHINLLINTTRGKEKWNGKHETCSLELKANTQLVLSAGWSRWTVAIDSWKWNQTRMNLKVDLFTSLRWVHSACPQCHKGKPAICCVRSLVSLFWECGKWFTTCHKISEGARRHTFRMGRTCLAPFVPHLQTPLPQQDGTEERERDHPRTTTHWQCIKLLALLRTFETTIF